MEGCWVVYKITAGSVVERIKVWQRSSTPKRRAARVRGNSGIKKLEANLRGDVKRLARILNANFSSKDLFVKLSFDELPEDWRAREAMLPPFVRRLRRQITKAGAPALKWVTLDSEVSGQTGECVRPHVHMILSGDACCFRDGKWWCGDATLEELWGVGSVYAEPLRDMSDYTPLAIYLLRQAGRQQDRKKWHSSRNMEKPTVEKRIVHTAQELRSPTGTVVTEKVYDPERGINYLRYIDGGGRNRNGTGTDARKERGRGNETEQMGEG